MAVATTNATYSTMQRKKQHNTLSQTDRTTNPKKMQSTTVASSINFWRKWLLIAIAFQAVFGLAMIFLPGVLDKYFWNVIFFSSSKLYQTFTPEITTYIHQVYGVLGAVMVGWSVQMFLHVKNTFTSGDRQAWIAIVLSLGIWFVLDSVLSIAMGYWQNAVLNVGFGSLFVIPLAASSKYFKRVDVPYV